MEEHPEGMYLRAAQGELVDILFAWPYKFYTTQNLGRDYNSSHEREPVTLSFNEDNSIFHMTCNEEDVESHITGFCKFMVAYIKCELNKVTNDILSGDAPQVEILSLRETNNLHRVYYLAARDVDDQEPGHGILIGTGSHLLEIPYTNHVAKQVRSRQVNTRLFDKTAEIFGCELKWLGHSLQISSPDDPVMVRMTKERISPAIALLEGVRIDMYWADGLMPSHTFRFYKVAKAADYTVYSVPNLITKYYDVHLTRWDTKSQQTLTVRPSVLYDIKWPAGARNPWSKHRSFVYRASNDFPEQRMDTEGSSSHLSSRLIDPNRAVAIHSWATGISTSQNADVDEVAQQLETTDIKERLDPFDSDMRGPRTRPAPRLKASGASANPFVFESSGTNQGPRPTFIDVLVKNVANLLSAIHLHQQEESSLVLKIGQLFVSSASANIPLVYRPSELEKTEAFRPYQWNTFFPGFPESEILEIISRTLFAPRLTSEDDDALFMSVTPLLSDQDKTIFKTKTETDRTYYRIRSQNSRTGAIAIIEINQDGTVTMKGQPREIGFVNVHFPAHMWDARFVSTITVPLSDMDMEAFGRLLSTVWIGHEKGGLASHVEPLHVLKPHHLTILSIQHRRERIHKSTETLLNSNKLIPDEKQVYLHLTRVEELVIARNIDEKEEFYAYSPVVSFPPAAPGGTTGEIGTSSEPKSSTAIKEKISSQRHWYEAHLHSSAINNILPTSTMQENPLADPVKKPSGTSSARDVRARDGKTGRTGGSGGGGGGASRDDDTADDDPNPTQSSFTPPEWNAELRSILHGALGSTFNAAHGLISQWNNIGCRDRGAAPHVKIGGPGDRGTKVEDSAKSDDNTLSPFVAFAPGYGPESYDDEDGY